MRTARRWSTKWLILASVLVAACGEDPLAPRPAVFAPLVSDSVFIGRALRLVPLSTHDGSVITGAPFDWRSSDSAIVLVDAAGTVFGTGNGSAVVSAVLDGRRITQRVRSVARRTDGGLPFVRSSAGGWQNCALSEDGAPYCIPLGAGDSMVTLAPLTPGGITFESFHAAFRHQCGLTTAGQLYCYGSNLQGQFGTGRTSTDVATAPVASGGALRFSRITAGGLVQTYGYTCGIERNTAVVHCAGYGGYHQTGHEPDVDADSVFAPIIGSLRAIDVSAGRYHVCAIGMDQAAYCWGFNARGVLGDDPFNLLSTSTPQRIPGSESFVQISSGLHACAVTTNREAYCWGSNEYGQLGKERDQAVHAVPERLDAGEPVQSVLAGNGFTCALTVDGDVFCWGLIPVTRDLVRYLDARDYPRVQLGKGLRFVSISADEKRICGVTTDRRVVCL